MPSAVQAELRDAVPIWFAGACLALLSGVIAVAIAQPRLFPFALVGLVGVGLFFALPPADWATLFVLSTVLSGNWNELGVPIPLDRVLLAVAFCGWMLGTYDDPLRGLSIRRPVVKTLFVVTLLVAALSTFRAGLLGDSRALFVLLDRIGLGPFALFLLGPRIWNTPARLARLEYALVGLGLYLSLIAALETLGLERFYWPSYIGDPTYGIHYGRARGPFVEAVANGFVILVCAAVASAVAVRAKGRRTRIFFGLSSAFMVVSSFLTLTRAVWLACILMAITAAVLLRQTRRAIGGGAVAAVGLFLIVLAGSPSLQSKATDRAREQRPVWDRINSNEAGVRAFRSSPIVGIGVTSFERRTEEFLVQRSDIPLTGLRLGIHNVPLARLAETGLVGFLAWIAALAAAIGLPTLRALRSERDPRIVMVAVMYVGYVAIAVFGPVGYSTVNYLLWALPGVYLWHGRGGAFRDTTR